MAKNKTKSKTKEVAETTDNTKLEEKIKQTLTEQFPKDGEINLKYLWQEALGDLNIMRYRANWVIKNGVIVQSKYMHAKVKPNGKFDLIFKD